ncbi:hypothetical protein CVT26_001273 [Gymnopilus dilepis]|uniref:Uncharacterized protein n=1 Tax=Gymnopilus dilepis TaxID=231916 RepID=A0A409Y208_9AGAR|nr:hypothetical protein CVT26_001273 [Gymnopilus dilepis]
MASEEVEVFPPPESEVLSNLVNSTRSIFDLLRPWYQSDYVSNALQSIKREAKSYVEALEFSIGAARDGYAIAEDALSFAESIFSSTPISEDERQKYLRGMLSMAQQGKENAERVHEKFRDVRRKVTSVCPRFLAFVSEVASLDHLDSGITTLEAFCDCLSLYIAWWNQAVLHHHAQLNRNKQVIITYNVFRTKDIVKKWDIAKKDFSEYINAIQTISDNEHVSRTVNSLGQREEQYPKKPKEQELCLQEVLVDTKPSRSTSQDVTSTPIASHSPICMESMPKTGWPSDHEIQSSSDSWVYQEHTDEETKSNDVTIPTESTQDAEDQETKLDDAPLGDQFVPVLGLESKVAVTDTHHQRASQHGRYRDVVQGPTDEPHGTHDKPTEKENREEVQADYQNHAEGDSPRRTGAPFTPFLGPSNIEGKKDQKVVVSQRNQYDDGKDGGTKDSEKGKHTTDGVGSTVLGTGEVANSPFVQVRAKMNLETRGAHKVTNEGLLPLETPVEEASCLKKCCTVQ